MQLWLSFCQDQLPINNFLAIGVQRKITKRMNSVVNGRVQSETIVGRASRENWDKIYTVLVRNFLYFRTSETGVRPKKETKDKYLYE